METRVTMTQKEVTRLEVVQELEAGRVKGGERQSCGQKIVYLLSKEGITVSMSAVYRVFNKHLQPRMLLEMDKVEL